MTYGIYCKDAFDVVRVVYSHLTKQQAIDEVERLASACNERGLPANHWYEQHHPDCVFVKG